MTNASSLISLSEFYESNRAPRSLSMAKIFFALLNYPGITRLAGLSVFSIVLYLVSRVTMRYIKSGGTSGPLDFKMVRSFSMSLIMFWILLISPGLIRGIASLCESLYLNFLGGRPGS